MSGSSEPISVLHVDDEPDFLSMSAEFLEHRNDRIRVEQVTTASEGLDRLRGEPFECVVSDHEMPGMDGLEFLTAVREDFPDLPFILFTGKGSEEVASEAISAGVSDYLQKKPGTSQYEILANRIENVVERRRARDSAAETERRLRALAENANDILWMFTGDWSELLFINSAYETIFGESTARLREQPRSFLEGIHPDDRRLVRDAMTELSAGESIDIEVRVNPVTDYDQWVWIQGEPVLDDGEVAQVVGFARDITARKAPEEDLQLMEMLVKEMNDGAVIAQDGVIEYANPYITELTGYPVEELIGERMAAFIAPSYRETVRDRHRARLTDEGEPPPEIYEIEIVSKAGRPVPVEISVSRIDYDGRPATLTLLRNISDREARKRELRLLKEEYETVFETAQDAIFHVDVHHADHDDDADVEFTFRRLNPAHEAISGLSTEQIRGKTPREVLGDEVGAQVAANYLRCVDAAEPIAYDEVLDMPARTIQWRTKLGPVITDGTVTGIVGVARDITDRKQRERELVRYETMVEASGDPMYTLDPAGRFTDVNEALVEFTGYEESALVGEHASKVMDQADVEFGTDLIRSLLSADEDRGTFEMDLLTADGDRIPCENHLAILPFEDEFQGTVGVLRDISDRLARERRLQRERDRLEEFASVVSHDLRNPLSVAEGRLKLAEAECDSDHLESVRRAHGRMGALIDDLLTLAREGGEVGDTEPVVLADLVAECWDTVVTNDATLVIESERTIKADRSRLQQLIENLIRNAVIHAGPDVTVTVGDLVDGFFVADDGPGIPEADRDRVLEAGFTTSADGTGFGLPIVREISEVHGWTMTITADDSGGARFEFTGVGRP